MDLKKTTLNKTDLKKKTPLTPIKITIVIFTNLLIVDISVFDLVYFLNKVQFTEAHYKTFEHFFPVYLLVISNFFSSVLLCRFPLHRQRRVQEELSGLVPGPV